jgi:hypothetical protein
VPWAAVPARAAHALLPLPAPRLCSAASWLVSPAYYSTSAASVQAHFKFKFEFNLTGVRD